MLYKELLVSSLGMEENQEYKINENDHVSKSQKAYKITIKHSFTCPKQNATYILSFFQSQYKWNANAPITIHSGIGIIIF